MRQLETGREECGILIALAVSTSRLKIRLNERWRDKEEERHLVKNTVVE